MKQRMLINSKPFLIICIVYIIYPCFGLAAETSLTTYRLEPIFVGPSLMERYYTDSLRHIEYAEDEPFVCPGFSPEMLRRFSSTDVQRRGPYNMQSDIQLRGASFEQTDIFINGVKANDPQTGHFNLDIPLFTQDIDRIFVISGPAAPLYGAGRAGGSVHIISKPPDKEKIETKTVFGSHKFQSQMLSATYKLGTLNSRSSLGASSCDGYRYNTDFDTIGFSHTAQCKNMYGDLTFVFHHLDKEFGANGFYSEFYPEQAEHTKTIFTSLALESELDQAYLTPQVYLRRHEDRYMLNRKNPSFYENFHTNYVRGLKLDYIQDMANGSLFTGVDTADERIDSTSLGKHKRMRNTLYSQYSARLDKFVFNTGLTAYYYEDFKGRILPDLGAGYYLNKKLKVRSAFSRSFRAPTFTELYYQSPANKGNENLVPEQSKNYEVGLDYLCPYFSSSVTVFLRKGKNLVDWVRSASSTIYQIKNISHADTEGVELNLKLYPAKINTGWQSWSEVYFSYMYIDRDITETGFISKYVFDHLRHKFVLGAENELPGGIMSNLDLVYQQRVYQAGDFVLDGKIAKKLKSYTVFFKVDNILDHTYYEKGNIPMPGRWLFSGLEVEW